MVNMTFRTDKCREVVWLQFIISYNWYMYYGTIWYGDWGLWKSLFLIVHCYKEWFESELNSALLFYDTFIYWTPLQNLKKPKKLQNTTPPHSRHPFPLKEAERNGLFKESMIIHIYRLLSRFKRPIYTIKKFSKYNFTEWQSKINCLLL